MNEEICIGPNTCPNCGGDYGCKEGCTARAPHTIPVDARELYWLRKFHADGREYLACNDIDAMSVIYDRMMAGLEQLEPWKDAPIPEEWR